MYVYDERLSHPCSISRAIKLACEPHVLAFAMLNNGTCVRVHYCLMLRGYPRRRRRTWVVGTGIGEEGIAYNGGGCHPSLDSARKTFERHVEEGNGLILREEWEFHD